MLSHLAPLVVMALTAAAPSDIAAMQKLADTAVAEERWCDGLHWYLELDAAAHDAKRIFNAAELARAGGDRGRALALYQQLLVTDAGFSEAGAAQTAIKELQKEIGKFGAGTVCLAPAATCGNGVRERDEACDDANSDDSDTCLTTCALAPVAPSPATSATPATPAAPAAPPAAPAATPAAPPAPGAAVGGGLPVAVPIVVVSAGVVVVALSAVAAVIGVQQQGDAQRAIASYDEARARLDNSVGAEGFIAGSTEVADARAVADEKAGLYNDFGRYAVPAGVAGVSAGVVVGVVGALTFLFVGDDP